MNKALYKSKDTMKAFDPWGKSSVFKIWWKGWNCNDEMSYLPLLNHI